MRILLENNIWNVELENEKSGSTFLFLLHGFSGSSSDWKNITPQLDPSYITAAVDILGHGKSHSPADRSFYETSSLVNNLHFLIKNFTDEKVFLLGYSMGGRLALSYAVKYKQNVSGLILESASAGIESEAERIIRVENDEELAKFIEENSLESFVDYWMNIDLFKTQKKLDKEILSVIRKEKLQNNKTGLANILRGFGTGKMPYMSDLLKEVPAETLLITGGLDKKFTRINKKMVNHFPRAIQIIVKDAGHNVHLEKPKEFLLSVNRLLKIKS